MDQLGRLGLPVLGRGRQLLAEHRAQPRRGPHRLLLPDGPAHLVQARCQQLLRVERRLAGQQFVEQHAQAVDVAARVDVQPAHLRLLRTHVGRRADELLERREERLVGQPLPCVALAMPKSITLGTGTPSCSVTRMFDGLMSR